MNTNEPEHVPNPPADAPEPPWTAAARKIRYWLGAPKLDIESFVKEACAAHAAALAQERDRALSECDEWKRTCHGMHADLDETNSERLTLRATVARLTAERDRLAAERHLLRVVLQEARTLVAEWLPTHTPMPPSKEELVLAQIDAALAPTQKEEA